MFDMTFGRCRLKLSEDHPGWRLLSRSGFPFLERKMFNTANILKRVNRFLYLRPE